MNILRRILAHFAPPDPPCTPRPITNAEVVSIEQAVAEFRELRKPKVCRPAPTFAQACEELRLEQELQAEIRADGNKVPRTAIARKRALNALKSC